MPRSDPCARLVLISCLSVGLAGCSLGGGSSKAGGPAPTPSASGRTVTVKFASGTPGIGQAEFLKQIALASGGRLRAVPVRYDTDATDVDQVIARDLVDGRIDVADVAARAWESVGVTSLRAFQSPFLLTSDALLDRVTGDQRVTRPLLSSLKWVKVTGLAVAPAGVRYLFARDRPLATPQAFAGARIRINESLTTEDLLRSLGARPTTAVRHGHAVVEALQSGRLDAVEADIRTATGNGYITAAPYISSPIFAKATTLAANSARLRALGPQAAEWIRQAAERTAAVQRAGDDSTSWAAACGAGVEHARSTPAQLDTLQRAALDVHARLDGDNTVALAIDRMSLHAARERAADPWAQCGRRSPAPSPTKVLDGAYEHTVSKAAEARAGSAEGNAGPYRVEFGHGRYAILRPGSPADPASPGWDFDRDPVEVGSVVLHGDVATMRPETSILFGSTPKIYRFELFRDRLRWHYVRGVEDFLMTADAWRKVG
jgi:TRAP-type C4-dicarboxylate transport system substrate-binding protein